MGVAGLGAIGAAVARTLIDAGTPVAVYNRSPGRATDLDTRRAATMAELAAGADLLVVAVTDAAAAGSLLAAAGTELAGTTVATFTTTGPEETHRLDALVTAAGGTLLDVGVQAAAADVGTPAATFVASGPRAAFDRHQGVLDRLGTVSYLGAEPAAAATWDLALFGLWYDAQVGLLRALDIARRAGLDPTRLADAAAAQVRHVVDGAAATAAEVRDRTYPSGPATLAEHLPLLDRLVDQRAGLPLGAGGLADIARLARAAVAAGHERAGLTAVVDEYLAGRA